MNINSKILKEIAERLNVPVVDAVVDSKIEPEDVIGLPKVATLYDSTFKIKYNGQKLVVRVVPEGVVITNRMLQTFSEPSKKFLLSIDVDVAIEYIQRMVFKPTLYNNDPYENTGGVVSCIQKIPLFSLF